MATGDTLVTFLPFMNEVVASNIHAPMSWRSLHPILVFDASTDKEAVFTYVMPQQYSDATGVTGYLGWPADGVTVNDCRWDIEWERIALGPSSSIGARPDRRARRRIEPLSPLRATLPCSSSPELRA